MADCHTGWDIKVLDTKIIIGWGYCRNSRSQDKYKRSVTKEKESSILCQHYSFSLGPCVYLGIMVQQSGLNIFRINLLLSHYGLSASICCELFATLLYLPGYMGWSKYFADHLVNKKSSRSWQRSSWPEFRSRLIVNFLIVQIVIYPILVYFSNKQGMKLQFQGFPSLA